MAKMIYSDYNECMIVSGFTRVRTHIATGNAFKVHYSWNETNLVYYNDEVDDDYFMECPPLGTKDISGNYCIEYIGD